MTTIFVVGTQGDYSEYSIHAPFSTRELAQAYIDAADPYLYLEIKEYELDPPIAMEKRAVWVANQVEA
jgi:hypothetical protein